MRGLFTYLEGAWEIDNIHSDSNSLCVHISPSCVLCFSPQIHNTWLAACRTARRPTEIDLSWATLTRTPWLCRMITCLFRWERSTSADYLKDLFLFFSLLQPCLACLLPLPLEERKQEQKALSFQQKEHYQASALLHSQNINELLWAVCGGPYQPGSGVREAQRRLLFILLICMLRSSQQPSAGLSRNVHLFLQGEWPAHQPPPPYPV